MQITVEIPDEIAQRLDQNRGSLSRRLLEVIVADAYNCGKVNTAEVRQILNLSSRLETHAFLKRMGVYLNYKVIYSKHLTVYPIRKSKFFLSWQVKIMESA